MSLGASSLRVPNGDDDLKCEDGRARRLVCVGARTRVQAARRSYRCCTQMVERVIAIVEQVTLRLVAIVRIKVRMCAGTLGRLVRRRLFHVQNNRKPRRCHAMTVSGWTITSAVRQSFQNRNSHTHSRRSARVSRSRGGRAR